jgi:hypothetical protein
LGGCQPSPPPTEIEEQSVQMQLDSLKQAYFYFNYYKGAYIDSLWIKEVLQQEEINYEERIDWIEVYSWKVKEPVDFLVTSVHIEDESKAELYRKTYSPKIERGICTNLNTNLQTVVFEDSRKAYTYSRFSRTNQPIERPTTIYITGLVDGKEQSLKHEVVLRNMQKKVEVKFTQAHSIVEKNIKVDFDFDKFVLNGKVITYPPSLVRGQSVLHIGAGLSKGSYTIHFADHRGNRSASYRVNKATNNGTIKLLLDLSSLSDGDWRTNTIVKAIDRGEALVQRHLLKTILVRMKDLLEQTDSVNQKDALKEISRLYSVLQNTVDVANRLTSEGIPFVKGICGAVDSIASNIKEVNQLIQQKDVYNKRSVCIEKIMTMIIELNKHITYYYGSSEYDKMIQKTWDYYVERTQGHATTTTITGDIEATFQRFILSE